MILPENHSVLNQDFSILNMCLSSGMREYPENVQIVDVCMHTAAVFWTHSYYQMLKRIHEPKMLKS